MLSELNTTSTPREIPESAIIETKYGAAVLLKSNGCGCSVAMVYHTQSGAYILPRNATRRWLWNCELAS